jgi:hypothetical protein
MKIKLNDREFFIFELPNEINLMELTTLKIRFEKLLKVFGNEIENIPLSDNKQTEQTQRYINKRIIKKVKKEEVINFFKSWYDRDINKRSEFRRLNDKDYARMSSQKSKITPEEIGLKFFPHNYPQSVNPSYIENDETNANNTN